MQIIKQNDRSSLQKSQVQGAFWKQDLEILECEMADCEQRAERSADPFIASNQADKDEEIYLPPKIEIKNEKPEKYNPAVKPLFKTSRERYEYLMEHGCTCNEDRIWLTESPD